MADEKKNSENPPEGGGANAGASPVGSDNIDELLASAAQSLSDIGDNLGETSDNRDSSKPQANSKKEKSVLQGEDAGSRQVDNTLEELEKELNNVVKEVDPASGSSSGPQAAADQQQIGQEVNQTTFSANASDNASSAMEKQVDEFLASVGKTVEESDANVGPEEAGNMKSAAVLAKPDGETEKVKEIEDIIDTLPDIETSEAKETGAAAGEGAAAAAVEGSAAAAGTAEKSPDQVVVKEDAEAGQQKENHTRSSQCAEEGAKAESDEKSPVLESKAPEKEAHIAEKEERKAKKEPVQQASKKSGQTPNKSSAPSQGKSVESTQGNYDHFSRPQQLLVRTLNKTDQTFSFVPDEAKDTIGLIAIITLIITVLAAAAILIIR